MRICIGGGAGFIGSHIAKRLKSEGHHVVVADWERNIYFEESEYCSEFHLVDLRSLDNCIKVRVSLSGGPRLLTHLRQVTKDCEWVFNMAADMGGMGFIHSNAAVLLYNNTMISFNMVEVRSPRFQRLLTRVRAGSETQCRQALLLRLLGLRLPRVQADQHPCAFSSSMACAKRPVDVTALKESDAWPAEPQDAYGFEKLQTEVLCKNYQKVRRVPSLSFFVLAP